MLIGSSPPALLTQPASFVQSAGVPGQQENGLHTPATSGPGSHHTVLPPMHTEQRKEQSVAAQQNGHASVDQGPPAPAGVSPNSCQELCSIQLKHDASSEQFNV